MKEPEVAAKAAEYLEEVGRLLSDIDEEDRTNLLGELADQLEDLTDAEAIDRLGSPEEFVVEFRRSAGLEELRPPVQRHKTLITVASTLLLPIGLYVLYSLGEQQLLLVPIALAVLWGIARLSPRPLQITWSVLAGILGAQVLYFIFDQQGGAGRSDGFQAAAALVTTAALITLLFYRTTRNEVGPTEPTSA